MSLSEKDQKTIKTIAAKFEKDRFAVAEKDEEMWLKRLEEKGTKIHYLNKAQVKAFHKIIADYSWPKLKVDIGAKYFDEAMKEREKLLK